MQVLIKIEIYKKDLQIINNRYENNTTHITRHQMTSKYTEV